MGVTYVGGGRQAKVGGPGEQRRIPSGVQRHRAPEMGSRNVP